MLIWNYARCKLVAMDRKEPTGSMFLIQKTSRLAGGFNFVRIDLKRSVKVGKMFPRLRRRRIERPKTKKLSAKIVWRAFDIWQDCLLRLKKLLTTDISNSVFISSSRWEAVIFPLERSRPMSGRIKINNAQCLTVSANGSLNSDTNTVDYAPSFFANSYGARFSVSPRLVILVY